MKDELVNSIVCMLDSMGVDTEGIADKLYVLMKDIEITPIETQLALRDDALNEQLLKRFVAAKMVKGCTKRTIGVYAKELKKILAKLGKPCTQVTADDVRVYVAVRLTQDGVSKTTANNEVRYLRTFYAWMNAEEIIPKNPMNRVERIKQDRVKKKAFSDMECERIRAACQTAQELAVVETLLSTGCRVSELVQIKIEDISDGKVVVHGKGNKDRTVYFNAKAELAIQKFLSERHDCNPYVFPAGLNIGEKPSSKERGGCAARYWYRDPDLIGDGMRYTSSIEQMVRRIGKRAGVDNVHPHRFRRTSATIALRRGMPIEMVSKMLGHEQISTTQIYLDLTDDDLEAAHKKYVV